MIDIESCKKTVYNILNGGNSNFLFSNLLGRFEYNLPMNDIDISFIELYLLTRGDCAIWLLDNKLVCTPCERIGNIDEYGRGVDLVCTTLNGIQKVFKNFKDNTEVVYLRNNKLCTPDILTKKDAESMTEILKSIDCAVVNTRYNKLIRVSNENQKNGVEQALKSNEEGKPALIISNNILDEDSIQPILLNDVSKTDTIQYLHRAYDDVIRRFWNRNGLEVCTSTKLAQQTKDEVDSGHNARLVETLQMLELRQKAMEEVANQFNVEASVKLSELWKRELEEKEDKNVSRETSGEGEESNDNE